MNTQQVIWCICSFGVGAVFGMVAGATIAYNSCQEKMEQLAKELSRTWSR